MVFQESASVCVGSKIVVNLNGIKGTVRFLGTTKFAAGEWAGVELALPEGKNNGTIKNVSYFQCPHNCGIFVRPSKISLDNEDHAVKMEEGAAEIEALELALAVAEREENAKEYECQRQIITIVTSVQNAQFSHCSIAAVTRDLLKDNALLLSRLLLSPEHEIFFDRLVESSPQTLAAPALLAAFRSLSAMGAVAAEGVILKYREIVFSSEILQGITDALREDNMALLRQLADEPLYELVLEQLVFADPSILDNLPSDLRLSNTSDIRLSNTSDIRLSSTQEMSIDYITTEPTISSQAEKASQDDDANLLKKLHAEEIAALRAEHIHEQNLEHAKELASLKLAHSQAIEGIENESRKSRKFWNDEVERLKAAHNEGLEKLRAEHAQVVSGHEKTLRLSLLGQKLKHEDDIANLRAEHLQVLKEHEDKSSRALRNEIEQLSSGHVEELAALRAEHERVAQGHEDAASQALTIGEHADKTSRALRDEIEQLGFRHVEELAALRTEHERIVQGHEDAASQALTIAEHTDKVSRALRDEIDQLSSGHVEEISALRAEHDRVITGHKNNVKQFLQGEKLEHEAELAAIRAEHARANHSQFVKGYEEEVSRVLERHDPALTEEVENLKTQLAEAIAERYRLEDLAAKNAVVAYEITESSDSRPKNHLSGNDQIVLRSVSSDPFAGECVPGCRPS